MTGVVLWLATSAMSAPVLTVDGPCPGTMTIAVSGLAPSGRVGLVTSPTVGDGLAVPGCDLTTDVSADGIVLRMLTDAAPDGTFMVAPSVPGPACGLVMQAVDLTACALSGTVVLGAHPAPPGCATTVIAHRGASGVAPENTLAALDLAFAAGAPMAEVDVRVSADGEAVLLHDVRVDRTTRALGAASDLDAAELVALDAGRWRNEAWVGEPVPTLVEALQLAHSHDAMLYLDVKTPAAAVIAAAVAEAGVPDGTVHLSFGDPFQLTEYGDLLPETPATWWGGIPDDYGTPEFDVDGWFDSLAAANVVASEHPWVEVVGDARYDAYAAEVTARGLALWTFTVNSREAMADALDRGFDAVETDFPAALLDIACDGGDGGPLPSPRVLGSWTFDGDLFPAADGSQLTGWGTGVPVLSTASALGLPLLPDGDPGVLSWTDAGPDGGLLLFPNAVHVEVGDGLGINRWTLVADLLRPASAADRWTPLMQTNQDNLNDAEVYIRPDGAVGVLDQYVGVVPLETWVRLAIVVDTAAGPGGTLRVFLDGELQGTVRLAGGVDSRFALNSTWAYSEALLFTDSGGFTSDVVVSALQLHERALNSAEVLALGGPSAAGIP